MSVQLIVYPQIYNGYGSVFTQTGEFCVDGSTFNALDNSSIPTYTAPASSSNAILSALGVNAPNYINTWYSYRSSNSGTPTEPTVISGGVTLYSVAGSTLSGIYQRLSNLVVGTTYEMTINLSTTGTGFVLTSAYDNITLISQPLHAANQSQITFSWTAASTDDTIVITYYNFVADNIVIDNISVSQQGVTPTQTYSDLLDGQVICDLYENEDIPLSLSVDDFKNVAEKVQSYSKAFKLPATKRNNKIFDHIFEVTRTDTGLNFNPYKKTKCVLKQDGFLLFEGYLKMIDISDKSGEISYNVNLYSEAIALSDVLSLKTFSDLDFSELQHDYQKQNIERSWNDSPDASIVYLNSNASGFRDDYTTLRYPFIDWAHQIITTPYNPPNNAITGMPELLDLQAAFRPCINVKYLLDRIFQDSPYSYQSEFFESDLFTKLYMDFSWGENISGIAETSGIYDTYLIQWCTTASFTPIALSSTSFDPQMGFNSGNTFTALADGQSYELSAEIQWENVAGSPDQYVETRWAKYNSSGTLIDTYDYINANVIQAYPPPRNTSATITCNDAGDYIQLQWKASTNNGDLYLGDSDATCTISGSTGTLEMTTNTLLQTLRGELNQWEFLKGLINMFNIVTMPHPNNPSEILFEPYYNTFIDNHDSKELNWTDKVDVTEIKLTPLTDLNKITKFRFAEDEDDYAASAVKASTGGHPYGTLDYIAPSFSFDLLTGEEEISAEPFATSVPKALTNIPAVSELITPAIYSVSDDGESQPFENSPRLFFNNGIKSVGSGSYYIPAWNNFFSANWTEFLQFSHLTDIPTTNTTIDINYETQQTLSNIGTSTANLFSLFWQPYYKDLYNPDTRIMTLKVNLTPSDVNSFNFYDTVMIKNRIYRVNKIDYKPNDLATVEFILIP